MTYSRWPEINSHKVNEKFPGFTLVELIVVITILAILGTIGFISIGSYSSRARDSERTSDMTNLSKGFEILLSKWGTLPQPDPSMLTLMASGTTIGYQGYAGNRTLATLSLWGKFQDPVSNQYYTYSTNANQSKYQILWLLENGDNISLSLNDFIPGINQAYAGSYESRFPLTKWSSLWILIGTGANLNQPVQELVTATFTGVDVVSTSTGYTAIFGKNNAMYGTGTVLKSMRAGGELASGLVGYWSFDESSGNTSVANYTKSDIKTSTFQDSVNFSFTGGKMGNGLYFTGASLTGITLNLWTSYQDYQNGTTISFFVKTFSGSYNGAGEAFLSIGNYWSHLYAGPTMDKTYVRFIPNKLYTNNLVTVYDSVNPFYSFLRKTIWSTDYVNNSYVDWNFHLHTISFNDQWKMAYFIDSQKIYSNSDKISDFDQQFLFSWAVDAYATQKIADTTIVNWNISKGGGTVSYQQYIQAFRNGTSSPSSVQIWKYWYWIIDELRIYNRALSDSEIQTLYNFTK